MICINAFIISVLSWLVFDLMCSRTIFGNLHWISIDYQWRSITMVDSSISLAFATSCWSFIEWNQSIIQTIRTTEWKWHSSIRYTSNGRCIHGSFLRSYTINSSNKITPLSPTVSMVIWYEQINWKNVLPLSLFQNIRYAFAQREIDKHTSCLSAKVGHMFLDVRW